MVFQKKKINEAIKEEIEERQIQPQTRQPEEIVKPKRPLVMAELPVKQYRKVIDQETGEAFEAISVVEALQEILESVRELKKAVI